MQNSTAWVQNYKNCSNVIIDSVHVFSNTFWNNDGIDLVDCKNARITNCIINAADDGICLKSEERNGRCENIYIANCRVRSSASAIKFGTASHGGFKKITVRNIYVYDTYRSAIAIETVDGGILEDIDVRNINGVNTGNAIFIRLGHRNKDSVYSQLRNVYIANVKVQVPKEKSDRDYPMEGPALKYPSNYKKDTSIKYTSVSPWNNAGIDTTFINDLDIFKLHIFYIMTWQTGNRRRKYIMRVGNGCGVNTRVIPRRYTGIFNEGVLLIVVWIF